MTKISTKQKATKVDQPKKKPSDDDKNLYKE